MAPIYIVSVLFMLALGSTPCRSIECTKDNIIKCYIDGAPDCIFRRKQIECMEKIDNSTCSDKMLERYTRVLSQARRHVDDCPGLPDGICYFNAQNYCEKDVPYELVFSHDLKEENCVGLPDGICYFNAQNYCEKDVPYELVFSHDLKEEKIKKLCEEFKGKEDKTRTCLKFIKPKCKADHILRSIDEDLGYVDDIQKKCASYE